MLGLCSRQISGDHRPVSLAEPINSKFSERPSFRIRRYRVIEGGTIINSDLYPQSHVCIHTLAYSSVYPHTDTSILYPHANGYFKTLVLLHKV